MLFDSNIKSRFKFFNFTVRIALFSGLLPEIPHVKELLATKPFMNIIAADYQTTLIIEVTKISVFFQSKVENRPSRITFHVLRLTSHHT
jgi:hypothetical protein